MLHVHVAALAATIFVAHVWFGQFEGRHVTLLLRDVAVDTLHLGRVNEGTLYADRLAAVQVEHVAAAYQLLGTGTVEDGLRVDTCRHLEGDTAGEVGLDGTRDDVCRRALGSDDHVDADGTGQLGDTCDGQFHLLAGGHDEVAKLIDDDDDIRHVLMAVVGVQLTVDELLVVFLDVAGLGHLQQVVARVHLLAE